MEARLARQVAGSLPGRAGPPGQASLLAAWLARRLPPAHTSPAQLQPVRVQQACAAASGLASSRPTGHLGPALGEADTFLAGPATSWRSLGLAQQVADALQRVGFERPAKVQELSVPALVAGRDAVLAAETGSGKTLAYLAPLLHSLLSARNSADPLLSSADDPFRPGALVLCPNAALCDQVVAAAQRLTDAQGQPLVTTLAVAGSRQPPRMPPDITVATPAGLLAVSTEYGPHVGRGEWTKAGLVRRLRHVVVDEADLLLGGGYARDLSRLLDACRQHDQWRQAAAACRQVGLSEEQFWAMPRNVRKAAYAGDVAALAKAAGGRAGLAAADTDTGNRGSPADTGAWRRQYVFVAATLPADIGTRQCVAAELQRAYPDAVWLSGQQLHRTSRQLAHRWLPVTRESWAATLQTAVREALADGSGGHVLAFAASVAAADEAVEALEAAQVTALRYHRDVPPAERAQALAALTRGTGQVLVCTDAAARGIDLPNVSHVVQADFASNAIDFLHRVGRTARAGRAGSVTSLYTDADGQLVAALRAACEAGQPVEGAFSRNRSFRKKVRKYGQYVPRGQAGRPSGSQT